MKLLTSPASPFARKVRVVLIETGQADQVTEIAAATDPLGDPVDVIHANPLGKIPALVRDDGPALYDSRVITRYLDARAGARLYPEARIWEVLTLEATADGIMDAALSMVLETRIRAETERSAKWVEGQWRKVERGLDAIEARWISHLEGQIDIGQIAVACALGYLDLRHGGRDWRAGRPQLAAWAERFAARDSMVNTAPPA
ncbi:MAG: glutathione S-transferase [Limimaricola cinnabarinus]|jgi:glutathione S-transferase|uniref:Glutathione S-transferase family protein n=1 Tax=Limimaricola cinnabarinus LL-001 TaxID=1337093 RepID=U3AAT1_9RHOB|nr:glutathione S-transferase [Limimaricola cinnabarinus]GAD54799.1 glutathione S-transferase family protein [Limimaricola cinnabarinus LL-001]